MFSGGGGGIVADWGAVGGGVGFAVEDPPPRAAKLGQGEPLTPYRSPCCYQTVYFLILVYYRERNFDAYNLPPYKTFIVTFVVYQTLSNACLLDD
jgi:hypothetical protein